MHMANELLSVPVAATSLAVASAAVAAICRSLRHAVSSDKFALMGVLGAFVFAAQMVNFQLPFMPGTSGHMVGAVLLAIILGPAMASIVMTSIIIVQCLIFQDGGLLALGCNIINMALIPSFLGFAVYNLLAPLTKRNTGLYASAIAASIIAVQAGACMVPAQAALSGILTVPFKTFLFTMLGVHLIIGIVEGAATAAVLAYLGQVRPDIVEGKLPGHIRMQKKTVLATFAVGAIVLGAGISLLASSNPDGLEWSYLSRPENPGFESIIANHSTTMTSVDEFHAKLAPLPDYTVANDNAGAGWTSLSAIVGSGLTMAVIYGLSICIRSRKQSQCTMPT
ncbi:MAG: hypothetical protein A2Y07_02790 [Planctomycetes bacterium GWF2_50_10]|nr:MAG: hypothetical protein A2Y07_02790 [Planctomycetes bacterium GWF2_50_10]